jgi:hypothetical protein
MKLMVESILLILSIESFNILRSSLKIRSSSWLLNGGIDTLDGSIGLEISVHLRFDLSEILVNILVSSFESLLGELSNFALHHALLVFEEAIGSTKEAIKGDNFLEETKFRVGFVLGLCRFLGFDGLFDCGVNLSVDLLS